MRVWDLGFVRSLGIQAFAFGFGAGLVSDLEVPGGLKLGGLGFGLIGGV